ncbi:hypothetical protein KFE25_000668 [Diacronema lutheri]|uniref:Glutathione S-transferase n=1 Tax=Diacronema lutheri TaxID=2081491 RepID=A0A8J5XRX6_DIALT|nr:hypothetical protein KFE25_000668 [Diacronema lutheri]
MLRTVAGVGAGFALGYCMPKLDALAPLAEPVEQALHKLHLQFGPKPNIQLTYFDIAGVAEKVRLTCVVGKLPFNDVRVSFEQWPKLKPTSKFGQLPMMEVDGTTVAQSSAMLNYVGKVTGMYPSEPKKALKVDEVIGLHEDLWGAIRPSILVMRDPKLSQKEAQRRQAEMRKELADEKIPAILGFFEKMLAENGTGFFVGSTPTTADIAVYTQLRALQAGYLDGIPKTCVDPFPKLKAFYNQINSRPEVEEWYKKKK